MTPPHPMQGRDGAVGPSAGRVATTQSDQILTHLRTGASISPLEALHLFGCMRLAARIAELREQGHAIATVLEDDGSRRWARYSLAPAKGQLVLFDYVASPQVPGPIDHN